MSAKIIELPARVRCDRAARELREGVIGVLNEIRRHGGEAAFHRAAKPQRALAEDLRLAWHGRSDCEAFQCRRHHSAVH